MNMGFKLLADTSISSSYGGIQLLIKYPVGTYNLTYIHSETML